jgi:hypothetical protein
VMIAIRRYSSHHTNIYHPPARRFLIRTAVQKGKTRACTVAAAHLTENHFRFVG